MAVGLDELYRRQRAQKEDLEEQIRALKNLQLQTRSGAAVTEEERRRWEEEQRNNR